MTRPSLQEIAELTAAEFYEPLHAVFTRCKHSTTSVRQAALYLAHDISCLPFSEIGSFFGMSMRRAVDLADAAVIRIERDDVFAGHISAIRTLIGPLDPLPPVISMDDVVCATAEHYAINPADIRGSSRRKCYARPRQIAMREARITTARSLPVIGQYFHRDHTTVIYAIEHINELMQTREDVRLAVDAIHTRALERVAARQAAAGEKSTIPTPSDGHTPNQAAATCAGGIPASGAPSF